VAPGAGAVVASGEWIAAGAGAGGAGSTVWQGVEASRLESIGHGWDRPVAPNDTKEGRARNRRTAFVVVDQ